MSRFKSGIACVLIITLSGCDSADKPKRTSLDFGPAESNDFAAMALRNSASPGTPVVYAPARPAQSEPIVPAPQAVYQPAPAAVAVTPPPVSVAPIPTPVLPVQPPQPAPQPAAPARPSDVTAAAFTPSVAGIAEKSADGLPATLADAAIKIDGSSTVYPITAVAKIEFAKRYANVDVDLPGFKKDTLSAGTGGGFKKFCVGETDISDASRAIKDKEIEKANTNNVQFVELPIAYDGITMIVNPKNDWAKELTTAELKKIWMPDSPIKVWKDIRPDFPDQPISLYGATPDNGTFDYFTEEVVGEARKIRKDYTASVNHENQARRVLEDPNAMGFLPFAYANEHRTELKMLAIDSGKGPVMPSSQTIADGTYSPLSRPIFVYVSVKAAQRPEVDAFIKFYLANIREFVVRTGYIPLPSELYALDSIRYTRRLTGSMFGKDVHGGLEQIMSAATPK